MRVINIHKRILNQPKQRVSALLDTLSSKDDQLLATDKWSPMRLDKGLKEGSKGGHGPIKYTVHSYTPGECVQFTFTKPKGFYGMHRFEIIALESNQTEIKHTIEMHTKGIGTLTWLVAIRWLHDAYIEDAFDKVENTFLAERTQSEWSMWVKILRRVLKPRKRASSRL